MRYLSDDVLGVAGATLILASRSLGDGNNHHQPQVKQQLAMWWERRRRGPIKVRARSSGPSTFPLGCSRLLEGLMPMPIRRYGRSIAEIPTILWKGVVRRILADDNLRLGPPSRQDPPETMNSPRIIVGTRWWNALAKATRLGV